MSAEWSTLTTWIVPSAILLGGLVAGLLARGFLVPLLARAARHSAWKYDDALVEAVRNPVVVWFTLAAARVALRLLPLIPATETLLGQLVVVLFIASVTWVAARFAGLALSLGAAGGALPGVTLIANVVRALVYVLGLLMLLQAIGISITPMITALGVGGLAVGLALQDTLANFFAGIRILAAGKIRTGDYVRLDSSEEGWVQDITWAQTTIRQLPNSLVIVPNARIAGAIATNYDLPDPEQGVVVPVGVSYNSDLELVERVTVEVAREVQATSENGVTDFEPFVRYNQFGDSSINFSVILRARHHTERFPLTHTFIKRLHARYRAEGIEIPFPQRDLHIRSGLPQQ